MNLKNNESYLNEQKVKKIFWVFVGLVLAFWLYIFQFLALPLEDESTGFLLSHWQAKGMLVYKDFFAFIFL